MILNRPVAGRDQQRVQALIERLLAEWSAPNEQGEPIIIQEASGPNQIPTHIYVVWSDWEDMSPLERSRIVMRAYEMFLGPDAPLAAQVMVTMGLTPREAQRLGIDF